MADISNMNARYEFMELILKDNWKALEEFEANQGAILSLFTSPDHVIELVKSPGLTTIEIITKSEGRLQKLFTTPQQFYNLYAADAGLATLFMVRAEAHFSTVFQNFDDIVDLALLDTSCGLSVFPAYSDEIKIRYRDAKVCDSLFELAAKESKPNLCLLMFNLLPMRNISQEDFDTLHLLMTNNQSIERDDIESWKAKYHYENSSILSSFGFFVGRAVEHFSAGAQWVNQSVAGLNQ